MQVIESHLNLSPLLMSCAPSFFFRYSFKFYYSFLSILSVTHKLKVPTTQNNIDTFLRTIFKTFSPLVETGIIKSITESKNQSNGSGSSAFRDVIRRQHILTHLVLLYHYSDKKMRIKLLEGKVVLSMFNTKEEYKRNHPLKYNVIYAWKCCFYLCMVTLTITEFFLTEWRKAATTVLSMKFDLMVWTFPPVVQLCRWRP